jgi:hypothetical protein
MKKLTFVFPAVFIAVLFLSCAQSADSPDSSGSSSTTLKIKNESFSDLTEVLWQNVKFSNNTYEDTLKIGTTVTQNVEEGAGYIFFKRKSNPLIARTKDLVIVDNGETAEFTFNNNTLVVEVNNPDNAGSLGSLASTVVFFDDAEGEMQQYYLKQSFVGYYKDYQDLGSNHYSHYSYHTPKNKERSIAIGGTNSALLHLKINLDRKAKLSFWYANNRTSSSSSQTSSFSINNVVKNTYSTNIDWSYAEYELNEGENNIIWKKQDGNPSSIHYYLTLDDILIYYIE